MTLYASPFATRRPASLRPSPNAILCALAGAVILADSVWAVAWHLDVDVKSYAPLLVLLPPLTIGAWFYQHVRHDPPLSAMLAGTSFLLAFSASCSLLSYLLLTVAGSRIDYQLAAIDQAIGFHWPQLMIFAANHRLVTMFLGFAYLSILPQIAAMLVILGGLRRTNDIYGLCLAFALGGLISVLVWAFHPSFGAFSVFSLPHWAERNLNVALNSDYGHTLVLLLKNGPGRISPLETRGLIGFPSCHTVFALVLIWYARPVPYVRWASLALNIVVLIATPIHGGHHLIDLAGGAVVATAAIALADWIVKHAAKAADAPAVAPTAGLTTSTREAA
jgi:hypothetical protein